MLLFDYKCSICGHTEELFVKITQPTLECPQCKNMTFNRCISAPGGLVFKGSGFYETDYKHKH